MYDETLPFRSLAGFKLGKDTPLMEVCYIWGITGQLFRISCTTKAQFGSAI